MIEKNILEVINKAAAIVVSYNPIFIDIVSHVSILKKQFPLVIIVDNSEDSSIKNKLANYYYNYNGIDFISLEKNKGIAVAQNIGIDHCIKLGFNYFCEFDQDSVVEEEFLVKIVKSFLYTKALTNNIAAIGPSAISVETGLPYKIRKHLNSPILVETTLSSGLFVSVESYLKIGVKAEELFIDLVDWEWCYRAKNKGLAIYVDPDVKIFHQLGENHKSFFGLFRYGTPAPFRHYYAFRNYMILIHRNYIPFSWKIKYLIINVGKFFFYPFGMDYGYSRFKYMCYGIYDGVMGKTGRF